jgi:hypothetical protein
MENTFLAGVLVLGLSGLIRGTSAWPLRLTGCFHNERFVFASILFAPLTLPRVITLSHRAAPK